MAQGTKKNDLQNNKSYCIFKKNVTFVAA